MSKEFIKIGPITCSIQADPPYKKVRNRETDFTLAKEKPALISNVSCKSLENGGMICEAVTLNFAGRMNDIGAEILTLCNGKNTIEKIAFELSEKHDLDDDEFLEQVKTFLNIFRTYKLL